MKTKNFVDGFVLTPNDFRKVGSKLSRPECVICCNDGRVITSDARSSYCIIYPDGRQSLVGEKRGLPNGICMLESGTVLVADIEDREIYRVSPDGRCSTLVSEINGAPLGAANYVYQTPDGRVLAAISTDEPDRLKSVREKICDGYIIDITDSRAPVVIHSGFCFTNEIKIKDRFLYVAETGLGRVSRGMLGSQSFEPYATDELFPGARVDGITFDHYGNLWVTELERNGLYVLTPDKRVVCVFEDPDGVHLRAPTSITFAGKAKRVAYVGSLEMSHIISFDLPDG